MIEEDVVESRPIPGWRKVKLVQGIWCDAGHHVVPKGEAYEMTKQGGICCARCYSSGSDAILAKVGSWE